MKAKIIEELLRLWEEHRGACLGLTAGAVIAIAMLIFGFWQTMFVIFMALAGLWLGNEYDSKADAWLDLKETLARHLVHKKPQQQRIKRRKGRIPFS